VQFKRFEPHILSKDEIWRIREYCRFHSKSVISSDWIGVTGLPSIPPTHLNLSPYCRPLNPELESDLHGSDSDSDNNWKDEMVPITFARYYAASHPLLVKVVQEHDQKMHERLDQRIATWVDGLS